MTKPDPPVKFLQETAQYGALPGTEDWHAVTQLYIGDGYGWTEWRVYFSPSARRYFWHGDSGCSCNYWADDVDSAEDFGNGSRADAVNNLRSFVEGFSDGTAETLEAVAEIKTYREPKA